MIRRKIQRTRTKYIWHQGKFKVVDYSVFRFRWKFQEHQSHSVVNVNINYSSFLINTRTYAHKHLTLFCCFPCFALHTSAGFIPQRDAKRWGHPHTILSRGTQTVSTHTITSTFITASKQNLVREIICIVNICTQNPEACSLAYLLLCSKISKSSRHCVCPFSQSHAFLHRKASLVEGVFFFFSNFYFSLSAATQ
jgi:hypothetical protein